MNVRIYQINMKRDTNHIAFMNYDSLPKFQGSSEIDSSLYDKVFEGEVNCFTLENLYEIFNLEHPAGYKGRSMSVSDVVEIIDGNNGKATSTFAIASVFRRLILSRKRHRSATASYRLPNRRKFLSCSFRSANLRL